MTRFHRPPRSRSSSLFAVLLFVLVPLLRPLDLCAAPMVSLQARVFLASNQPGVAPDPRLASLIEQLRKALPYSNFQLLGSPSGRTGLGQAWKTELPGGRTLELMPTAIEQGTIQLQARIVQRNETLVSTILRLQSGGLPVVIGGPAYQNGVLVIVISASVP